MVCALLLLGTGGKKVAALFRAIGAHFHDHFSLIILPGLCKNDRDPDCKVGSLYPVSAIRMVTFKGKCPKLLKSHLYLKIKFVKAILTMKGSSFDRSKRESRRDRQPS